jgi:hypothetical protein
MVDSLELLTLYLDSVNSSSVSRVLSVADVVTSEPASILSVLAFRWILSADMTDLYLQSMKPMLLNLRGSAGGSSSTSAGGKGGGIIDLNVAKHLLVDGEVSADGSNGQTLGGGGSGGSIYICLILF